MQHILRKRVWRNLKKKFPRYLALVAIITMSMYLIVSIVAASDTIILGAEEYAKTNRVENGEFTTFVPLTEKEISNLTEKGIALEKNFYLDFRLSDDSVIRIFKNREKMNLVSLVNGRLAANKGEVVLERRYCDEHDLAVGDTVNIASQKYTICGIGTAPDYEAAFKNMSDSSVDSIYFGVGWLVDEEYESLLASNQAEQSEEYVYSYLLNDSLSDSELKEMLKTYEFLPEEVKDEYFQDYWNSNNGNVRDLEAAVDKLNDGSTELAEGLDTLQKNNGELCDGAKDILDLYLAEGTNMLTPFGLSSPLTVDNFDTELEKLSANANAIMKSKIVQLRKQIQELQKYSDGVIEYTDSVGDLKQGASKMEDGAEELNNVTEKIADSYYSDNDVYNLKMFVTSKDNPRIGGAADDKLIYKYAGLMAGVIILILFTFVLSVFVTNEIEQDSSIIGTLYALGVKRKDLLIHYLYLPVVVTLIAGILGMLIGFADMSIATQMQSSLDYYSLPNLQITHPIYLIIYAVVMPPVIAILVNCIVIYKKLNKPVLKLIKKETKQPKINQIKLKKMSFTRTFQIRQILREFRGAVTVVLGMFIALLLLMLGLDVYAMCSHISVDNKADVSFEYMYTYKYPDSKVPEGGTEAYSQSFKMNNLGYQMDVTMMGIANDNSYFHVSLSDNQSDVSISSAMAQKFGLKEEDSFIIEDGDTGRKYAFCVSEIIPYSPSFYIFMNIDQMRELFGATDDYFNVVFSSNKLDIPSGQLYAVTAKEDIEKASDIYISLMWPLIYMMIGVAAIVFVAVMYLMLKMMLDRSVQNISLVQIFGYRGKEIRKLYLDGNFLIIAIGAAIAIPLSKKVMDTAYPYTVADAASAMDLSFSWYYYVLIYVAVLLLYFIVNRILMLRIRHVTPADILKNGE